MPRDRSPPALYAAAIRLIVFYGLWAAVGLALGAWAWTRSRRRRVRTTPLPDAPPSRPAQPWWYGLVFVVLGVGIFISAPWCDAWHWERHPPAVEHRQALLDTASRQLHCPPEQLVIDPVGDIGAKVKGCGGQTELCWRQLALRWPYRWQACE